MLVWGFEVQGLVRPLGVVGVDPCPQGEAGVFEGLEVPGPSKILLEGLDKAFAETVFCGVYGVMYSCVSP